MALQPISCFPRTVFSRAIAELHRAPVKTRMEFICKTYNATAHFARHVGVGVGASAPLVIAALSSAASTVMPFGARCHS